MIILPPMRISTMVAHVLPARGRRAIGNESARLLHAYRFRDFTARLTAAANRTGCRVWLASEAHTSSTCGCCGRRRSDSRLIKEITCAGCGTCYDRDEGAARSIMLCALHRIGAFGSGM